MGEGQGQEGEEGAVILQIPTKGRKETKSSANTAFYSSSTTKKLLIIGVKDCVTVHKYTPVRLNSSPLISGPSLAHRKH